VWRWRALAACLAAMLWVRAAAADDASPSVTAESGLITGRILVDRPLEEVRKTIGNPWEIARIDGGGVRVRLVASSDCDTLAYAVPTFLGPLRYTVRYCREAQGWSFELVESEDLEHYEARWIALPKGDGTELRYELRIVPQMAVPRSLVEGASKRSVRKLLNRLRRELEAPP
jgi:hypothetical protein